jgi:large subunit ribosomal protein L4e
MKAPLLGIDGKKTRDIELPEVFSTPVKGEAIKRAFLALVSERLQPKGNFPLEGLQTSAEYVGRRSAFRAGINIGSARLPHAITGGGGRGDAKRVPHAKGGMRTHPPKVEKVIQKFINKKEKALAMRSALAATADKQLVAARGHKAPESVPVVVENSFEAIGKTKQAAQTLGKLGLSADLERAQQKKIRAGKAKMRGKKYRRKKSVLVVVSDRKAVRALRNIPGVDATTVEGLNIELLAPGAVPGRLAVFTESALKKVGEKFGG